MTTLTSTQIDALRSFRHGHGYGRYAGLRASTAKSLARMGLAVLSFTTSGTGINRRTFGVGHTTEAGNAALKCIDRRNHVQHAVLMGRLPTTAATASDDEILRAFAAYVIAAGLGAL